MRSPTMAEAQSFRTKELVDADECRLLQPGHWALLWYEGDHVWHKRLLLYPSSRDQSFWICASPDWETDPICEEAFLESDADLWAIAAYGLAGYSDKPQPKNQHIYDFEDQPSLEELRKLMEEANAFGKAELAKKGETLTKEPNLFLRNGRWYDISKGLEETEDAPPARRMRSKEAREKGKGGRPGGDGDVPAPLDKQVWLSLEATDHCKPGDVIESTDVKVALDTRGVAQISTSEFAVLLVDETGHRSALKDFAKALVSAWREDEIVDDEVDARVLLILYASGRVERRFRRWRDVADAITEEAFDDWPLEDTVRSVDWLVQQVAKGDKGPIDYVDTYLARHPYQPSDRSQFELKCLAEILEMAGCYDQLNLSSLAWVEVLGRRWQMILDAHSRNPLAPNYEASEFYNGSRKGRHGIAPMLSAHVAKMMKDESEIDKQRSKARDAHDPKGDGKAGKK